MILRLIWLNCIDSHYINYLMPALELTVLKVVFGFSECLPDFSTIHADAVDSECLGYEMVHCILMQPVSTVDSHEVLPK